MFRPSILEQENDADSRYPYGFANHYQESSDKSIEKLSTPTP